MNTLISKKNTRPILIITLVIIVGAIAVMSQQHISASDKTETLPPLANNISSPVDNLFTQFGDFQAKLDQASAPAAAPVSDPVVIMSLTGTSEKDTKRKLIIVDDSGLRFYCDQIGDQFTGGSAEKSAWSSLQETQKEVIKDACNQL